jgi:glycerol-1-phosphate dehydrogenase [NAD(P)+]
MTWHGCKKTLTAVAPKIVVADIDVIKNAPIRLSKSGFGDMIGKYVALTDWKISNILTGEFYCDRIANMTYEATQKIENSIDGILSAQPSAYENLMYGLLMSGLAMQLLGNSRCASGAEHHISHLIEMSPPAFHVKSDALHGEKVGVGTLIASNEYHRIKSNISLLFGDYKAASDDYISDFFGSKLKESVIKENENDCAASITENVLRSHFEKICEIIKSIPTADELVKIYNILGAKTSLSDIDVPKEKLSFLLEYSPLVRNRLTLMRLRRGMNY